MQILGQLEAAGQRFDRVWLLGLDDAHWPTPAEPNAFLPLGLQREHSMPHAAPQLSLARAERLTRQLLASAQEVIVSTPRREGDVECMPSALIADLPHVGFKTLHVDIVGRDGMVQASVGGDVEMIEDHQAPYQPTGPDALVIVPGGSGIFADQAACPFRAFAKWRLGATALHQPGSALNASVTGNLVH
ncbi:MAG: PD-(D/E)XK nuclease family protein, partial [Deltaproteobacteria bacterium]|nr:PD-(D/E)XK nuclease family protein [Deltaproteobacteria bacterium]